MENNNQQKKTSLGTVFGVIGALIGGVIVMSLLGNSSTQPISETNPSEKLVNKEQYYYDTFVKGCEKGGATPSECQCILTKVKQRWTLAEFEAIGQEYAKTNKLPEALGQMATDCLEV